MHRIGCTDKRRDQNKTSCDCTALRRIDAGTHGFNRPADEIKCPQYLQLYIEPVFWFDDPYGDL